MGKARANEWVEASLHTLVGTNLATSVSLGTQRSPKGPCRSTD